MPTRYPTVTSGWKPKGRNSWHTPLPAVTVPAQDQIDGMVRLHLVENIGRMGQQQRHATVGARWKTPQIGPMERWIIDADDHQLSPCH